MPLILSVTEGDDIFINDDRLIVEAIYGDGRCDVMLGDQEFEIGDAKSVEVMPEVLVSAGLLANNPRYVRLVFKAPRSIMILRGEKYRAGSA